MTTTGTAGPDAGPRNRTHYLYIAVIVAVALGVARRPRGARRRRGAQAARHRLRRPDQDDDPAGHLLHDRARRRLGGQRRPGRQGRRPRPRLLPQHVDGRARHRPRRRQHDQARRRAAPGRRRRERRPGAGGGRPRQHRRVPAGDHPRLDVLQPDQRRGAADPAGRAAGRLRAAADGRGRQAGPPRRRAHPAGRVPGARDDHVGCADRRLRRDRRRGRRDRGRRAQEPGHPDGRLLHHLLVFVFVILGTLLKLVTGINLLTLCATWPASSC